MIAKLKNSFLKTWWVIFSTLFYTAKISSTVTFLSYFKPVSRKTITQMIHTWTHHVLNLAEIKHEVFNPHHVTPPKHRAIMLMCNHASIYDIPLSFLAFPQLSVRMLAKKEISRIPIFAQSMKIAEFPFVDRHNRQQAMLDLKKTQKIMESGISIWVAPEGTRSKTGELGPFKKGAFMTAIAAEAVIIPICIKGATSILPAKTFRLNFGQKAEIHIGQPLDTRDYGIEKRDLLMEAVRKEMLDVLMN